MKKPVRSKSAASGRKSEGFESANRSWSVALLWAGALVGGSIILSAVVNPLFGRYVHWDWMAVLAPTMFVLITLSLRRRWV